MSVKGLIFFFLFLWFAFVFEGLRDALFAMAEAYLYAKFLVNMLGQMLGTIHATMLTARTAEAEHQVGKAALQVSLDMSVGQLIYTLEEGENLAIILEETDNRFVDTGKFLVRLVSTGVVRATAVEDIAAAIAACILGDTLAERETEDAYHQGALAIVTTEGGRSVLGMRNVWIVVGNLVSVGSLNRLLGLGCELRQFHQLAEHLTHIGIGTAAVLEQLAQILDGWRYALEEMLLALEVATEAISAQHLQQAEEDAELEVLTELKFVHLDILLQAVNVGIDKLLPQRRAVMG